MKTTNIELATFANRINARAADSFYSDAQIGFGGYRKTFIAPIRQDMLDGGLVADRAAFDAMLIAAMRAGLVILHRCDMTPLFDYTMVCESELVSGNATFHFVGVEVAE